MKWFFGFVGAVASLAFAVLVLAYLVDTSGPQRSEPVTTGDETQPPQSTQAAGNDGTPNSVGSDATDADSSHEASGTENSDSNSSGQLQYDPAKAEQSERETNAEMQTRPCLSDYSKALLRSGVRDKKFIASHAISICGSLVTIVLTQDGKKPSEIAERLNAIEDEELDAVLDEGQ